MYFGVVAEAVVYFLWFSFVCCYHVALGVNFKVKSWKSICRRWLLLDKLSTRLYKLLVSTPQIAPMGSTQNWDQIQWKEKSTYDRSKRNRKSMSTWLLKFCVSPIVQNEESVFTGPARSCCTKYTQYSLNANANFLFNSYLLLLLTRSQPSRWWFLGSTDILNKLASHILVSINPKIIFKRDSQSKAFTATYAIQSKQKEVIIEGSGAHTLR